MALPGTSLFPCLMKPLKELLPGILVKKVQERFKLDLLGLHGQAHWARVLFNGLLLCEHYPEADWRVVSLFSLFHDVGRVNEKGDRDHGKRGSEFFLYLLEEKIIDFPPSIVDPLLRACDNHTKGQVEEERTVQVCWDSDRLDLLRAGIKPSKEFLCTLYAKDSLVIEGACKRSESLIFPEKFRFLFPH